MNSDFHELEGKYMTVYFASFFFAVILIFKAKYSVLYTQPCNAVELTLYTSTK